MVLRVLFLDGHPVAAGAAIAMGMLQLAAYVCARTGN